MFLLFAWLLFRFSTEKSGLVNQKELVVPGPSHNKRAQKDKKDTLLGPGFPTDRRTATQTFWGAGFFDLAGQKWVRKNEPIVILYGDRLTKTCSPYPGLILHNLWRAHLGVKRAHHVNLLY